MEMNQAFSQFLDSIRPTDAQRAAYRAGHSFLKQCLVADDRHQRDVLAIFLQGSHRRATAIRPRTNERPVVDIVVVTALSPKKYAPHVAIQHLESRVCAQWRPIVHARGRSLVLAWPQVLLHLVITSAPPQAEPLCGDFTSDALDEVASPRPAEASAWQMDPLLIPNREVSRWESTHPMAQLAWSRQKNSSCNGYYLDVVKAIKWWQTSYATPLKALKSYPLEALVGDCCPDGVRSVGEGVTFTLEAIRDKYTWHGRIGQVPWIGNPGIAGQNVLARVPADEFAVFMQAVTAAARTARQALDEDDAEQALRLWRALFGPKFTGNTDFDA